MSAAADLYPSLKDRVVAMTGAAAASASKWRSPWSKPARG